MTLRFEISPRISRADWGAHVISSGGNPLHHPEVLLTEHQPGQLLFLLLRDGDEVVGCTVGTRLGSGWRRHLLRQSTLYLPTPPAVREEGKLTDDRIFTSLLQFCRLNGFSRVSVDGRWGKDFSGNELLSPGIVRKFLEFELSVDRPDDMLLGSMDKYHRKNIRRAERHGINVVIDSSLDGLERLRELQLVSAARATERGNPFQVRDPAHFARLHKLIYEPGLGEVAFAKMGEEIVAGLAYLRTENRAITVRSGATPLGYEKYATYLLQYHVLLRLRDTGISQVNMGGVPYEAAEAPHPQHGLYSFKKGFGGTPKVRTSVDLDVKEGIRRMVNA